MWTLFKETKKLPITLPSRALYDFELKSYAEKYKIPYFRGVFMRDALPKGPPWAKECAIVNLDSSQGTGTHWVAYIKNDDTAEYFDSFGNLKPPKELVNYLKCKIMYNRERYQNYNSEICGRLCLEFLMNKFI